ncbi:MAG: penicillin-binding protein 2 [Acidimicrobiales bacterium]|nr:penicillin-binding protein 2 [Acidimicrobiales bacterium]
MTTLAPPRPPSRRVADRSTHPSARTRSVVAPPPSRPSPRAPRAGNPRRRLGVLLLGTCLAFAAVAARLVVVQGVEGERYAAFGASQRIRAVELPAERGSIFDRNGVELAMTVSRRTVWADPRLVEDPQGTAAALAPVLGMLPVELLEPLTRDAEFVYLARKVDDAVAEQVDDLDLPGVSLLDESARDYPAGDLARSVLGAVDVDNIGISGLELAEDEGLTGTPGQLVRERDPQGRTIPSGRQQIEPAVRGDDLVLTLDRSLQYEAERALAAQVTATGARGGLAVVMRPSTGEVLALATIATPDDGEGPPVRTAANTAVTSVFEPGSVNKVITVAGALEEGLVRPDTFFYVPSFLQVADEEFTDNEAHGAESWSVRDILVRSSNIGTILIAQQLGRERIDRYLRDFGLGSQTALAFPGESAGIMLRPEDWSGTSIGTVPIGQGISVTALQMLTAFNVIANGGVYVPPRLVLATVDGQGVEHRVPADAGRRVVSEATAEAVTSMMAGVVGSEEGTGRRAAIDGYAVAGKTGTARKPIEGGVGYRVGAYMSVFAGFVPAGDPQVSIIVVVDEPQTSIYGGVVAAPVFADLGRYALRLLRVPPAEASSPSQGDPVAGTGTVAQPSSPASSAPPD